MVESKMQLVVPELVRVHALNHNHNHALDQMHGSHFSGSSSNARRGINVIQMQIAMREKMNGQKEGMGWFRVSLKASLGPQKEAGG